MNWCRRFLGIKEVVTLNTVKEELFMGETLLASVSSEIEAGMIETLLAEENIPVIRKQRGAGQYLEIYMAMSTYGVDLYVAEEQLEMAKALVGQTQGPSGELDEEMTQANKQRQKMRRIRSWVILLLVVPGLVWFVIFNLKNLIDILR